MTTYPGLEGRTIVVTGAGGGQGAAEARVLAEAGARVIATDVMNAGTAAGGGVEYRRLDVSDDASGKFRKSLPRVR